MRGHAPSGEVPPGSDLMQNAMYKPTRKNIYNFFLIFCVAFWFGRFRGQGFLPECRTLFGTDCLLVTWGAP